MHTMAAVIVVAHVLAHPIRLLQAHVTRVAPNSNEFLSLSLSVKFEFEFGVSNSIALEFEFEFGPQNRY